MTGKIEIYGQIGECDGTKGIELIDVISQVRRQPEATSFNVYIDSEGGRVDVGFDIYNYLKSLGLPITTIGEKLVASMGTVIFMAGNRRIVSPDTQFMIHLPMGGIEWATSDDMENYSKMMKETENQVVNFYTKQLGLNKEAIFPLLRNETWLTKEQLIDMGFVTQDTDMKVAAKFNRNQKSNKMAKKSKLEAILAKLFKEPVCKMIYSADGKELNFPDIPEDGAIEIGAKATYDGQPIGGTEEQPVEIAGQDGNTYVFVDSVLTVKVEPSEEEVTDDEMVEALSATLELVGELSERLEKVEKEAVGLKADNTDLKDKLQKANTAIAALKGKSDPPEKDKKDKKKDEGVSSLVAQWRASKKQVKNN